MENKKRIENIPEPKEGANLNQEVTEIPGQEETTNQIQNELDPELMELPVQVEPELTPEDQLNDLKNSIGDIGDYDEEELIKLKERIAKKIEFLKLGKSEKDIHIWAYPHLRKAFSDLCIELDKVTNHVHQYRVPYHYIGWNCSISALAMVLDFFNNTHENINLNYTQEEIWKYFSRLHRRERWIEEGASSTEVVHYLRSKGLDALSIKLKSSAIWGVLQTFSDRFQIMFDVRYPGENSLGHTTVLNKVEGASVSIHNPGYPDGKYGPDEPIFYQGFSKQQNIDEIRSDHLGNWIIIVSPKRGRDLEEAEEPSTTTTCQKCGEPVIREVECPHCNEKMEIPLYEVLGCSCKNCENSNWEAILCRNPNCINKEIREIRRERERVIIIPNEETRISTTQARYIFVKWATCGNKTITDSLVIKLKNINNEDDSITENEKVPDTGTHILKYTSHLKIEPGEYYIEITSPKEDGYLSSISDEFTIYKEEDEEEVEKKEVEEELI